MKKSILNIIYKIDNILIKSLNKPGKQKLLAAIFQMLSGIAYRKNITIKFENEIARYVQYEKGTCYYVNITPSWRMHTQKMQRQAESLHFKYYTPKKNDIIVELGAGIGTETVILSEKVGNKGKVYAIEAHPETYNSLKALVEKRKLSNVIPLNMAIAGKNGFVHIDDKPNHEANKLSNDGLQVQSFSFDSFVENQGIKKIDYLKVNIEGAELQMIDGMNNSVKKIRNMAISCHDFLFIQNKTNIKQTIEAYLNENNFEIYTNNTKHIVQESWIYATLGIK